MKVTILGCGGSGGVPLANGKAGGDWGKCDPSNPKNRRRRVSVLVEEDGFTALIDASPDLRLQILDNGIERIDAILFTHAHGDHCHGVDDLRFFRYRQGEPIPAYMDAFTQKLLTARFSYAFSSSADPKSLYRPLMDDRVIDGPFDLGPWRVVPFIQNHGPEDSLGFRVGDFAYSTDVKALDEKAFSTLEGLKLWILDCLRDEPHPTHSHTAQSLDWIGQVCPKHAVLTHLNHQIDYEDLKARCPDGVEPAYDGLCLSVN
ncbi:MAG: MBL fold metallo-hydrolase [Kiloniellales bacterium]|nr:MBL fold metallo-hydrolase [Kiloniellales bacterium]